MHCSVYKVSLRHITCGEYVIHSGFFVQARHLTVSFVNEHGVVGKETGCS